MDEQVKSEVCNNAPEQNESMSNTLPSEIYIARVKHSRLELAKLLALIEANYFFYGEAMHQVKIHLMSARHWMGEHLSALGGMNPYINGNNVENTIVDPPADVPAKEEAPADSVL